MKSNRVPIHGSTACSTPVSSRTAPVAPEHGFDHHLAPNARLVASAKGTPETGSRRWMAEKPRRRALRRRGRRALLRRGRRALRRWAASRCSATAGGALCGGELYGGGRRGVALLEDALLCGGGRRGVALLEDALLCGGGRCRCGRALGAVGKEDKKRREMRESEDAGWGLGVQGARLRGELSRVEERSSI
jgi:hypothetical protein